MDERSMVDEFLEENFGGDFDGWDFNGEVIEVRYFFAKNNTDATRYFTMWEVLAWVHTKAQGPASPLHNDR